MKNSSNHFKGVMFSVIAGVMWGVLAIALKVTLKDLSPESIVCARFAIAFLILSPYLLYTRPQAFEILRRPPLKLVIASLALGFNYYGFMKGVEYTSPSNAQVFIQLGPVIFALIGIFRYKEKITWKHIIGFIMLLCGLGLFFWEQLQAMTSQGIYSLGILWVVGAAIAWAIYAVLQKDLASRCSVNQLNLFIFAICTVIFIPFVNYGELPELSLSSWALVLFLGFNTLIAYGAIALAFRYLESNKVTVIVTTNPVLTFILMFMFEKMSVSWITPEHFSVSSILGAFIALGGAVFVVLFTRKE